MKLELKPTNRGFLRADFLDQYGKACSIQESSLATGACIWLGMDEGLHLKNNTSQEWTKEELEAKGIECLARMHLTQEMALEIGKQLIYFGRKGKLKTEKNTAKYLLSFFTGSENGRFYIGIYNHKEIKEVKKQFEITYSRLVDDIIVKNIYKTPNNRPGLYYKSESMTILNRYKERKSKLPWYWELFHLDDVIEWLSEGQQGFYTPTGLVKELP